MLEMRDAVLHLDAGVHFHEEGLALAGDDPFPGAHVVIAHLAGHGQGVVDDVLQHLGGIEAVVHLGGHEAGGHFHALLQAGGLDGAVAGAEVHGVLAAAVGHDLDFQVVEVRDALFDEHALVLELAQGVVADAAVHGAEVVDVVHVLDAHAATAGRSLDQHQRALYALLRLELEHAAGDALGFHLVIDGAVGTGNGGHVQAAGQTFGVDLVAQLADDLPRGADEDHLAVAPGHATGKAEVLGEETVTGMHGRAAGLVGHGHQFVGVMIGRNTEQAAFAAVLAGVAHMARSGVFGGKDGGKGHTQLAAGPHDAYGDLAAVGDENLVLLQRVFLAGLQGGLLRAVLCRSCGMGVSTL